MVSSVVNVSAVTPLMVAELPGGPASPAGPVSPLGSLGSCLALEALNALKSPLAGGAGVAFFSLRSLRPGSACGAGVPFGAWSAGVSLGTRFALNPL